MGLIDRDKLLEEVNNGINASNMIEGYEEYENINCIDDVVECVKYADTVKAIPLDRIKQAREELMAFGNWKHDYEVSNQGIMVALGILDKLIQESEE